MTNNFQKGFTLIEVMIAVTLFSVIMIVGTGAVLNSNATFRKTENIRTIIDNLHFVMEDVSRSIRTGNLYDCASPASVAQPTNDPDCFSSFGSIAFNPFGGDANDPTDDVVYAISTSPSDCSPGQMACVIKSSDGGASFFNMTSGQINIDTARSGFIVTGALPSDGYQPRVVIRLAGEIIDPRQNISTPFSIETAVSQRTIDS